MSTIGSVRVEHEQPSNLDFIDWDIVIPGIVGLGLLVAVGIQVSKWWTHQPHKENSKARAVYRSGNKNE